MNILIKLTCLVGLAIAPILGEQYAAKQEEVGQKQEKKEIKLESKLEKNAPAEVF